ncbi:F-box protein AFR [Typha angustifolia]|uniref:F-box protein AFR n=1 Tax=Typha angustifolia TaxID=59011 RepID=UPI003C30D287
MKERLEKATEEEEEEAAMIPGLPDEVAELCLLHLPFPYQTLARSVSAAWNRVLSSASFLRAKAAASPSLAAPYVFVFAFDRSSLRLQWQALDPGSKRWFVLPPMPVAGDGEVSPLCPPAFACAAVADRGELYVLGGMRAADQSPLRTLFSYRAGSNSWAPAAPMPTPRSFFAAGAIGGKIYAAGGGDGEAGEVECYDPTADSWRPAAGMRRGMARYDAAVVGRRMYVTEGWAWPFDASPRGGVYDADRDAWEEMAVGLREGWTGASAVAGGRLYVVAEYGDSKVKRYDEGRDTWKSVSGGGVPPEVGRPFAVVGDGDGRIYVAGSGLDVAVGKVEKGEGEEERVEWEVVKGPPAFADLAPCNAQVLYV